MNIRRSTDHDFSSLNIYSDGSRTAGTSSAYIGTRGHRKAKDAFSVPKYKTVRSVDDDGSQDEEFDFTGVDLTHAGTSTSRKGKERETTPEEDFRSVKRRKLAHDFSFLETSLPYAVQPAPSAFAVPSSDLLKCIHHFACNYYADRGQLFNASRTYRKAKRQRRLAKLAAKEKAQTEDPHSGEEEEPVLEDSSKVMNQTQQDQRRDMYKTMDGSALLAIGMLLQEHIARILAPKIPDGWEQGVLDESEEDSSGGEDEDPDDEQEDSEDDGDENADADEHSDNREHEDHDLDADGEDSKDTDEMGSENNMDDSGKARQSSSRYTSQDESDMDEDYVD